MDLGADTQVRVQESVEGIANDALGGVFDRDDTIVGSFLLHFADRFSMVVDLHQASGVGCTALVANDGWRPATGARRSVPSSRRQFLGRADRKVGATSKVPGNADRRSALRRRERRPGGRRYV